MRRLGTLVVLGAAAVLLGAADRPAPSTLDKLAAAVATWVADDEPVAIHVTTKTPALAPVAALLADLVAARSDADKLDKLDGGRAARAAGYAHYVEIEVTADATDLRALGRVFDVGHDLWAEAAGVKPGKTVGTFVCGVKLDAELRAYIAPAAAVVAPTPVTVAPARPRKLAFRAAGSIDLGAPLLDLAAGDLDGDGKAELVALTTDEIIVLTVGPDGVRAGAREALGGPPPVPRPRTPVGSLVIGDVDGRKVIRARSSLHAAGADFTYAAGTLGRAGDEKSFPLCNDPGKLGGAELVAGVSLFGREPPTPALPARFVAARCGAGLLAVVDAQGVIRLWKADGPPAAKTPLAQVAGAGTAFVVADLDGDGKPELVTAELRAPGAGDGFIIYTIGGAGGADGGARVLRRGPTTPTGIIAIAAGDLDGDGALDVVGASRGPGNQVDLWLAD